MLAWINKRRIAILITSGGVLLLFLSFIKILDRVGAENIFLGYLAIIFGWALIEIGLYLYANKIRQMNRRISITIKVFVFLSATVFLLIGGVAVYLSAGGC